MSNRTLNFVLLLGATMLIATALSLTKNIMVPFVLSVFLVYAIQPGIAFLEKKLKIKRQLAILLLLTFITLVASIFFAGIGSSIKQIVQNSEQYQERVIRAVNLVTEFLAESNFPIDLSSNLQDLIKEIPLFGFLSKVSQSLVKSISDFTLVAIFSLFLLSGSPLELPEQGILAKVNRNIRAYLMTKILTSSITGLLTGFFLILLKLDMAVMFGLLAFLLNFIPTIGSIIATLLPLPIALLQFSNPWLIGLTLAVPGTIQFTIGNIIEPKLIGQNLDLHPVTILLSLMFWGFLWGISGMLLATPITVILKLFLSTSDNYYFFSELMAGRIKFSPPKTDTISED